MEEKELIFEQNYDVGEILTFFLYREQEGDQVTVSLTYQFKNLGMEPVTCKRIFFPLRAEYGHSLLSWYNLICCSNNYGPIPVLSYLNTSVQRGKKLAATIYPESGDEYMRIVADAGDDYHCFPYQPTEYEYLLYISKKGILSDYFDLDGILRVYESCDVLLDREKMQDYFGRDLSWFGNEEECPIQLHDCLGEEELATVGLLFGYPVESTIALIRKDIDTCGEQDENGQESIS